MNKKAFTLTELVIVMAIMVLLSFASFWNLAKDKIRLNYDEATYELVWYLKNLRTIWMTNYVEEKLWTGWNYKIPQNWYWFEFSATPIWTGSVTFKLFYNEDNDTKFSSGDIIIKERISNEKVMLIEKIYWSWSSLAYPLTNWTADEIWTSTWTIIFRSTTWDFPDDWSVFISAWNWTNNLKNITFEFYLIVDGNKLLRRISFDRISKILKMESCKYTDWVWLEICGVWKKWSEWF